MANADQVLAGSTAATNVTLRNSDDGSLRILKDTTEIGRIASSGNTFKGVTDGSNAAAGEVGESVESISGIVNAPTTSQYGDVTSITLTAGDWDVCCLLGAILNGATMTRVWGGIGTVTGNSSVGIVSGSTEIDGAPPSSYNAYYSVPPKRFNLTSTTTLYLKCGGVYSAGTPQFRGRISARRVR